MNSTIDYYNKNAKEFCENTVDADMSVCINAFLKYLKPKSKILDAGCGSGRDSKVFIEKGYDVTAIDASPEICKLATEYIGMPVVVKRFEYLNYQDKFDGIWACASLLHIEKSKLSGVIDKLHNALKCGGVIYASFKYGESEEILNDRYFSYFTEDECRKLFEKHGGFDILECFVTLDVREECQGNKWVNIIGRKR